MSLILCDDRNKRLFKGIPLESHPNPFYFFNDAYYINELLEFNALIDKILDIIFFFLKN